MPSSGKKKIFSVFSFICIISPNLFKGNNLPRRPSLLLSNLDGLLGGQGKCILRNACAGKKKKPESHSYTIKDYNLIEVGTKGNQTMVAFSTLFLAFLNIWEFDLKP